MFFLILSIGNNRKQRRQTYDRNGGKKNIHVRSDAKITNDYVDQSMGPIFAIVYTDCRVTGDRNAKVVILHETLNRKYGIKFFHTGFVHEKNSFECLSSTRVLHQNSTQRISLCAIFIVERVSKHGYIFLFFVSFLYQRIELLDSIVALI